MNKEIEEAEKFGGWKLISQVGNRLYFQHPDWRTGRDWKIYHNSDGTYDALLCKPLGMGRRCTLIGALTLAHIVHKHPEYGGL